MGGVRYFRRWDASLNKCLGTKEHSVLQIVALCGLGPGEWRVSGDSSFSVGVRVLVSLKLVRPQSLWSSILLKI